MEAESDDNRLAKFKDEVEEIFQNAETQLSESTFDFEAVKVFVTNLRQHVESYTTQGCPNDDLEAAVLERASTTASTLVNSNQKNQKTFYDPHQAGVYLVSALSVSSLSQFVTGSNKITYTHSERERRCLIILRLLYILYVKEDSIENLSRLACLLVNLASWVEPTRPHVSRFIVYNVCEYLINPNLKHPEIRRLSSAALVVDISSCFRMGAQGPKELHKRIQKVNEEDLSKQYKAKFNMVYAKLLCNCQEYIKARERANDALNDSQDEEERREIEQLLEKLESAEQDDSENEEDFLTDTNMESELSARQVQKARHRHRPPPKYKRRKRSSITYAPSVTSGRKQNVRLSCPRNQAVHWSSIKKRINKRTTERLASPVSTCGRDSSTPQPPAYSSESETDDDVNDEEILRFIGYDDDEKELADDLLLEESISTNDNDEKDWFEKSEERLNNVVDGFDSENIELSPEQTYHFEKDTGRDRFYEPLQKDTDDLDTLVKTNPDKYKRCQLKIEFSHKSIARVLDKGSKFSEILISGRSKCGQTYMDDEVVVEVLTEPVQAHRLQGKETPGQESKADVEKMAHGCVVGMYPSRRVRFRDVEHPVLICTQDEIEGHLMKPLCKTVPKIHVMNDKVKEKYPALTKHRVEIKQIINGKVEFKRFLDVDPDKREQYVFKVVILSWRMQSIYPLGAILEAHIGGRDFSGGLQVLTLQHSAPGVYPRKVIHETQALKLEDFPQKAVRLDLTSKRIFTIDPPGSQDLDDALSISKEQSGFVVGIHIADIASFVIVGTAIDEEAKRRAFTFYPGRRKPRPMFPEPLSHGKLSLLPGQERLALSVFFCFDEKGKLNTKKEPGVTKTIIKSTRQFSYEEIQKVIDGDQHIDVDQDTRRDVLDLHMIASQLREARIENGGLFVPFEDPRLHDLDNVADSLQAHSLVEEFMILTNKSVAKRLRQKFPHVMILRAHKPPTYEQLAEWREKEGNIANLVMQLQGKKTSLSTKLSVIAGAQGEDMMQNRHVIVQEHLYNRLRECLEEGNLDEARKLLFMDSLHPLQCLAYQHWMEMMEAAEYKCSHGLKQPDHYHFGLDVEYYTHFTSPIRRYVDLHVHRLLHADLDGKAPDCKAEDVVRLCQHLNNVNARQKAFSRGCRALALAEKLQTNPLVFRAYVDNMDCEQLTFCLPSLLFISDRKQEVPFSVLGVSSQPKVIHDNVQKKDMATVRWGMRFYNKNSKCEELIGNKTHLEESDTIRENSNTFVQAQLSDSKPSVPIVNIHINPNQLIVFVGQGEWANMLKLLMDRKSPGSPDMPAVIERNRSGVDHISSENGDGTVSVRRVRFSMTFSPGQVIPVQMSAEPKKGLLKPRVELVQISRNANVCTHHMTDPVAVLSRSARASIRSQEIESYKEYRRAWMPLLEMEAAYGAGTGDSAVVIENVEINMKCIKRETVYQGTFSLPANFCFERGIEFGGKSAGSTGKDNEYKSNSTCPMDYLCLRCQVDYDKQTVSRVRKSSLDWVVDDHYTWVGHGGVISVTHKNREDANEGLLHVKFVLSPHSKIPPQQLFNSKDYPVTLEVLPKSQVDRRAQEMLFQLEDQGNELAQAIAFNKSIPELDKYHRDLGQHTDNQKIVVPTVKLPVNNKYQQKTIERALTNSLSLIQGPPGTGKTYTGIKLVYLFTQINRKLAADGKGKKVILFCGQSNKFVDNVARLLKLKFGNKCPKMVRLYGSAIESKDYPVPRGDLQNSRGMRDLTSDPELRDVSLHHIIRESDKPYAEEIATFEKYFLKCCEDPKNFKVTSKQMRDYKRLLYDASVEELAHYEVIFTTCAVGGSPKLVEATKGAIFQVIIDECAMSPEPHSLVPIVANKAKQVVLIGDHKQLRPVITCQAAAELGLDQSLFERLYKRSSVPCVFLNRQYRMHPQICEFPSNEFYEGRLKSAHITTRYKFILPIWPLHPETSEPVPHIFVDVRGEEETLTVSTDEGNERSKSNTAEAEKVIEVLTYLKSACEENKKKIEKNSRNSENTSYSIKVLTQYNAQKHLLQEKLSKACTSKSVLTRYDKKNIPISTVVSSQGDECDYVVLSTVRSLPSYKIEPRPTFGWCRQNMGFITDQNQVNVALTRARRGLIIVGNAELLKCDPVWNRLITRYEELGCVYDSADFPPTLLPPRPRVRPHRQPVASDDWQQV